MIQSITVNKNIIQIFTFTEMLSLQILKTKKKKIKNDHVIITMSGNIIEKIITPDFSDPSYLFDFTSELIVVITFFIGLIFLIQLRTRYPVLRDVNGNRIIYSFIAFTVEAIMNFIDGNLIWFNETNPLIILPSYQIWRLIRGLLVFMAFLLLMMGFKEILQKFERMYGEEI